MMASSTQNALRGDALRLLGAHYLTGAAGAHPGGRQGALYRESLVEMSPVSFDRKKPCVYAATTTTAYGHSVCGGRWETCSGRPASNQAELDKYLSQEEPRYKSTGKVNCYFESYTPRTPKLKGKEGPPVWGEDCRDKRHFDCIGLVNFLLSRVCNIASSYKQMGISGDIAWHHAVTTKVPLKDQPVGGDILIPGKWIAETPAEPGAPPDPKKKPKLVQVANEGHIGLLLDDGKVIQAASPELGVIIGPYDPNKWFYRGRHSDGNFVDFPGMERERPILSKG